VKLGMAQLIFTWMSDDYPLWQGGPWRKKASELDGSEDEKELPWWVIDYVLHNRLPPRENAK
jgi:hypothetical protein